MAFLNIEAKEDTPEKLAYAQGKPTKHFIFQSEINQMTSAINTLRWLITLNSDNIAIILSQSPKIDLEVIFEPFLDVLNANETLEMSAPKFVTFILDDVKYVYVFVGINGTYGTGNGLLLTMEDFILVYQSDAPVLLTSYELYGKLNFSTTPRVVDATRNDFGAISITPVGTVGVNLFYQMTFPEEFNFTSKTVVVVNPRNVICIFRYYISANTIGIQAFDPTTLQPISLDNPTPFEIYIKHQP